MRNSRHAIHGGAALIAHLPVRRLDDRLDLGVGIDGMNPDADHVALWGKKAHFNRGKSGPGQNVAAGWLEIYQPIFDADLRKEIVNVAARLDRRG